MSDALHAALGEHFELTRRDSRVFARANDKIATVAHDELTWRRLRREAWLAERWCAAGVPAARVILIDDTVRMIVQERHRGRRVVELDSETGPRIFEKKGASAHLRLADAELTAFGVALATHYGKLARNIRQAVTLREARDFHLPAVVRTSLDVDLALALLEASAASSRAKAKAKRLRDALAFELPPDAVIHGELKLANIYVSDDAIVGVANLETAGVAYAATELGHTYWLGSRFASLALAAYGEVDVTGTRLAFLRQLLTGLVKNAPRTALHAAYVEWASAAFEAFG